MRKPADIAWGLDDRPPLTVLLTSAFQQSAIIVVLVYPAIILGRELGSTPAQAASLISMSLLVGGIGTALQSYGRFGMGCGYLAPSCSSAIGIGPSVLAAKAGGLPLVAGMTIASGIATLLLARLLHRLRALLPPEVAGVVAFIVGLAVSLTGVRTLAQTPDLLSLALAGLTLAVAVGLSVWGKGMLRWTCVLTALIAGSLAAAAAGRLHAAEGFDVASVPLVGLPDLAHLGLAFDIAFLPPFLVLSLAASLKIVGLVTTLQKINDADWVRAEPRSIAGGLTAEGATVVVSGLVGALPMQSMGVTNITVQSATGITSRMVGYATAAVCVLLACFPRAGVLLSLVPGPVLAAILMQAGGAMLVNGMQVATSRMLDARKSLAVGLALVAAIGVEALPGVADLVPPALRPLMTATALGTVVAILLNAVLRIGIRKQVSLTVPGSGASQAEVVNFVTRAGASWGARPDVVVRAADLALWCLDAIAAADLARGDITLALGFDEFRIDLRATYRGVPLELATAPPSPEELVSEDGAAARLAGHMIRRRADRAAVRHRDGVTELSITLDH